MSWALRPREGLRMLYPPGSQCRLTLSGVGPGLGAHALCPPTAPHPASQPGGRNLCGHCSHASGTRPAPLSTLSSPLVSILPTGDRAAGSPGAGGLQDHGQHPASARPRPSCLRAVRSQASCPDASAAPRRAPGPQRGAPAAADLEANTAGSRAEGEKWAPSEKPAPERASRQGSRRCGVLRAGPRQTCAPRGPGTALRLSLHVSKMGAQPPHVSGSQRAGEMGPGV